MKINAKKNQIGQPPLRARQNSNSGIVLLMCMVMIAALCFIAGTTYVTLRPEIKGAKYFKDRRCAFYNAEAGVQYLIDSISRDIAAGNVAMTGAVESVSYSAPTGYDFDTILELNPLADGETYTATVTGRCMNARAVIEFGFRRPTLLISGALGDVVLDVQPNIQLYSYDSRITTSPTAANSTGKANPASNGNIIVKPGVIVDGVFLLGEDELGFSPTPISGYENRSVGPIDADPLGADGGMIDDAASYYSDSAHNDNSSSADIVNNVLSIKNNRTGTLQGGHYYLEDLNIAAGSTLEIDGSPSNPAVIFLNGPIDAKPGSSIITSSRRPSELYIFSVSDQDIVLYPNNNFDGMIYAPMATIEVKPGGNARGIFIAKYLTLEPNAVAYIDTSTQNEFKAPYIEVVQWRQVID